MKIENALAVIICITILMASTASAYSIAGLYNTGVDNNHQRLPDGDLEQHYAVTGMASSAYALYNTPPNTPQKPYFPYVEPAADALWIAPPDYYNAPSGEYFYTLTFNLAGMDSTNAEISGQWSSDNESSIYLNGFSMGFAVSDSLAFTYLSDFTITEGFVEGVNTLEFRVMNSNPTPWGENPTTLLVQNLQGQVTPEPGTLLLLGFGGLSMLRRNRK